MAFLGKHKRKSWWMSLPTFWYLQRCLEISKWMYNLTPWKWTSLQKWLSTISLPVLMRSGSVAPGEAVSSDFSILFDSTLETTFDSTNKRKWTAGPYPTWQVWPPWPGGWARGVPSTSSWRCSVPGYRLPSQRCWETHPHRPLKVHVHYASPSSCLSTGNMSQIDMSEKASSDLDMSAEVDVGGYMSDGDILRGKVSELMTSTVGKWPWAPAELCKEGSLQMH